ncbi:hypothetical protein [Leifsonia shinshuensis]|uniref:hypothetical protein n=1 Tax=Leifsonia shinshuensis TaxID=150026 RepID=UPI00285FEA11|nr:hypothetical protein [Leifsonia shinshuensis]MDR6971622.1 hypothetical protein [Leifsonia shinshuensis]
MKQAGIDRRRAASTRVRTAPRRQLTPLGAVFRGAAAGVIGTLAMDLVMYRRYRRDQGTEAFGEWEFSADVRGWDNAPAPAQVGRRVVDGLFERELPDSAARQTNNIMHWGYSVSAAVGYGLLAASLRRPCVGYGLLFGAGMWAFSYVILPPMHLYKPITEYDAKTLGKDLTAHLAYGLGTAAALWALLPHRGRR